MENKAVDIFFAEVDFIGNILLFHPFTRTQHFLENLDTLFHFENE
jgi:hypothetical protein